MKNDVKYVCEDCGKKHTKAYIDKHRGATQDTDLAKIACSDCGHRTINLVEPVINLNKIMEEQGEHIARQLNLRPAKQDDGKPFNPPRYQLGKEHGTKTAVGVLKTVIRLAEEAKPS